MPVDSPLPLSSPSPQRAIVGLDTELPLKGLDFARVVFLDFDGVLHPQDFTANDKFCYLANFCEVVRCVDPLHNLPLVVSSTWRHHHSLQQMRGAFPADIAAQIVGATPYMSIDDLAQGRDWTFLGGDPYKMMHRQREIRLWLHVHAPGARWLAIDDRPDYFDEGCPNLFTVPGPDATGGQGLTSEVAIDLLDRLKNFIAPALRTSGSSPAVR